MNDYNIEQQLNYIKRKLNERTALSNLSNYANIAERLSNGNINIELDSVNKIVNFSNGADKIWLNVKDKTLNNVNSILFADSRLNGIITKSELETLQESPDAYTYHGLSAEVFQEYVNDADNK